jgi:uroporphyrin-III C-methyltransferase/precorrin-2 dehydrogenase/sirohydrochlorin ferrochelatase
MSLVSRRRAWQFLMERSRFIRWNNRSVEHIVKEMRGELHKRVQGERAGQVYLVGAGPGRAELLTLRAVEVLQEADVIFHDRLVSPEILERARRDAELVDVGKRAGKHQGVQQRIFELMVEAAREGKTVVRLKGGDAFVFGRGGEELEYLRDNGIEYEVVPGITAALGCAAYAGIPLTHRDYAHQLTIATGHLAGPEWTGVPNPQSELPANVGRNPRSGETLVVYMGVKQATSVRAKLMERGFSETTPAALIINGTMDAQRVLHGTVSTLPAMAAQVADGAPGLFIIGKVAALGQELAWFKGMSKLQAAA